MNEPVLVSTLNIGDKFVLESYSKEFDHVYLVVDKYSDGWVDCVEMHSGKDFTMGKTVSVIPVEVELKVRGAVKAKPPTDLTGKCGSCFYASAENKSLFPNTRSYVQCLNPERHWHREIEAYRARTTKCCKLYKPKENVDGTAQV